MMSIFVFSACQSDPADLPEDDPADLTAVQRHLDHQQLIAFAVFRVFDDQSFGGKSFSPNMKNNAGQAVKSLTADNPVPKIKYRFDVIKIYDALQYFAQEVDFPFLNEICGYGEIEVFKTPFMTYIYDDETEGDL
jgi:hypothetical protein